MSVQNAERLIRFMQQDEKLKTRVREAGSAEKFEAISGEAGASCSAYDFVVAVVKTLPPKGR